MDEHACHFGDPYLAEPTLLSRALAHSAAATFIVDRTGHIVWANEAYGQLNGYAIAELIGHRRRLFKSAKQNSEFERDLRETVIDGHVWRGEIVEQHRDGSLYTVEEIITPLRDENGVVSHLLCIQHDITQQKEATERERYLAYHDALTGLANRAHLDEVLRELASPEQHTEGVAALLFIDLDKFKYINDFYGHAIGDRLLVATAERLRGSVRKFDTVARLGGDEFVILQTGIRDTKVLTALTRKLLHSLSQPFLLDGHMISISASIGVAIFRHDGDDAEEFLANADKAMYAAKRGGRNGFRFFDPAETTPMAMAMAMAM